jgi:hypothetical protein
VGLLEAVAQLTKRRHDRRLLLHSLGDGLAHFMASLLLALGRRVAEAWAAGGSQEEGEEEERKEALAFLLTCLLLAVQVFGHAVPAWPHYCWLVGRRGPGGPVPRHPWSAPRVASMCLMRREGEGRVEEEEEEEGGVLLERSMRALAVRGSWSLLAIQEGVLPAVVQALRLAVRVSGEMAAAACGHGGGSAHQVCVQVRVWSVLWRVGRY